MRLVRQVLQFYVLRLSSVGNEKELSVSLHFVEYIPQSSREVANIMNTHTHTQRRSLGTRQLHLRWWPDTTC